MTDSSSMLDQLRALSETDAGRVKLKRAFAMFDVRTRKWSEMTSDEIEHVWAEVVGPTPPEGALVPTFQFTQDDSPEGAALNARLDSIKF